MVWTLFIVWCCWIIFPSNGCCVGCSNTYKSWGEDDYYKKQRHKDADTARKKKLWDAKNTGREFY